MIYFILWVVFIVALILAVPITQMMENRGRRAALAQEAEALQEEDAFADEGEMAFEESPEEERGEDDFGGEPAMQEDQAAFEEVDDFAAFEEDFK